RISSSSSRSAVPRWLGCGVRNWTHPLCVSAGMGGRFTRLHLWVLVYAPRKLTAGIAGANSTLAPSRCRSFICEHERVRPHPVGWGLCHAWVKFWCTREAVGPRCPWYLDPYTCDPYGCVDGEDRRNMHSCPMRIPG